MEVRRRPCATCPYRRDVPAGIWSADEYLKLPEYDRPTGEQPLAAFSCHSAPDRLCAGWAQVHSSRGHDRELLALRFRPPRDGIPEPEVPLFNSGTEAAEHGLSEINDPGPAARLAMTKLIIQRKRRNR